MIQAKGKHGTRFLLTMYVLPLKRVQRSWWACFMTALTLTGCGNGSGTENKSIVAGPEISRIIVGSCAHQNNAQEIWEPIVRAKPDLFIFMGDNIYGDTYDMEVMRAKYRKLGEKPGYQALKSICPVLAVWDDHDYGLNDAGKEYEMKEESEKVFHQFFETPEDSEALQRPGIYQTRYFGESGKRLQIILLDTRYFRDALVPLPEGVTTPHGRYDRNRDPKATILGEAQWTWLEQQLKIPADLRIIVSSIQFLPQDHHWELWENFPLERAKLLNLLKSHVENPVLFVSGDRHMGEMMELKTSDPLSPGYPVYELTSSGLTNAGGGRNGEPNRHRVSPTNFRSRNFGMVEIDWSNRKVGLSLGDITGKIVDRYTMGF